jgi:SAM-dependent methyltransferase
LTTIVELQKEIQDYGGLDADYYQKMIHKIPPAPSVDRTWYFKNLCRNMVVLDIGCNGPMHDHLKEVSKEIWGIDRVESKIENYIKIDVEKEPLPLIDGKKFDIVICGEILEHLSNPGQFLEKLKVYQTSIVLSVPNAFADSALNSVKKGIEQVNKDHVAYYSYFTLKNLVERQGYTIDEFLWYNGEPNISEGLIFAISNGGNGNGST